MSPRKDAAPKLVPGLINNRMLAKFTEPIKITTVLEQLTEKLCDLLDSALRYQLLLSLKDFGINKLVNGVDYMAFDEYDYAVTNVLEAKIGKDESEFLTYILNEYNKDHDLGVESLTTNELIDFAEKMYDSELEDIEDRMDVFDINISDPQLKWLFDLLEQIKVKPIE